MSARSYSWRLSCANQKRSTASVLQITPHGTVTEHETKFAYPTKMTSLTIKIKEKLKAISQLSKYVLCFFSSYPVIMAVLKDSKRQTIVGAFSIFLGAKFIFSTDAVYKSDNMETQTDQGETAFLRSLHFFLSILRMRLFEFTASVHKLVQAEKAVNHRKVFCLAHTVLSESTRIL